MAFKLGTSRSPVANEGQIESKFSFRKKDSSVPGTPIIKKSLGKGILGEANNDGSMFISNKVKPGSEQEQHVIMHEMVHLTDMKIGKLAYNDDYIKWNGKTYKRKEGMMEYEGKRVPEGDNSFDREQIPGE